MSAAAALQAPVRNAPYAPSATPICIRFADVDMMQVVHHGAYVHWFEQVRFNFLEHIAGMRFADLKEHGVALPVIGLEASYLRSFRFNDRPVGYARVQLFAQAKFVVHYEIRDAADDRTCVTGATTHCYTGRDGRLLLRTPEFLRKALEQAKLRHPGGLWIGDQAP